MPRLMMTLRSVSGDVFNGTPNIGSTRYLSVPDGSDMPKPGDAIRPLAWVKQILGTFTDRNSKGAVIGDLVFLVHGYNTSAKSALGLHDQLSTQLKKAGFPCTVVSFDWPSEGVAIAYLEDRMDAKITAMRLVQDGIRLFVNASRDDCQINVHVVAHSMGAFVVREAFRHSRHNQETAGQWVVSQVALLAGDISSSSMTSGNPDSEDLYANCHRLTNYFSGRDSILQISNVKRLGLSARVGRIGLPGDSPDKAIDVDCASRYQNQDDAGAFSTLDPISKSHVWYFHDDIVMQDLAATLNGSVDRSLIPRRQKVPMEGETYLIA